MKTLLVIFLASFCALNGLTIGPWQDIRFSGKTADDLAWLQTEITHPSIRNNRIIYHNGTAITETDQTLVNPAFGTYQSQFPVATTRKYLGLRVASDTASDNLIPVYYEGTALPALSQMTRVSLDPQNDTSLASQYNYLDITADYFTFSGTKFYAAMQNRGGGYPTSAGLGTVYLSYMLVIANPADDPADPNTIVWAMNYMSVPLGGLSPGLFRIAGGELIRIGDITSSIVSGSNLLIMSCNISDLMADAAFAAWYNPANPVIGYTSLTSRTTVIPFGTTQADTSPGGIIYPIPLYLDPAPNLLPVLANPAFHFEDDEVWFGVSYNDPEGNFPLTADVIIPGTGNFPLYPMGTDFTQPVSFRTANLLEEIGEYDNSPAAFSFSDNNIDYATLSFNFTYIRGLLSPDNVTLSLSDGFLLMTWDPVTLTLDANPVTVTGYRIEVSASPDFADYSVLDTIAGLQYQFPVEQLPDWRFIRILAVKEL